MADSTNYVPSSTGMGQGAAQVFSPQAIGLDTSSLEKGMYAVGGGIAKSVETQRAAQAEEAKRRREIIDAVNRKDYQFPQIIARKQAALDNFYFAEDMDSGYRALMNEISHLDALDKNAKSQLGLAQKKSGVYKDVDYFLEDEQRYAGDATRAFDPLFDPNLTDQSLEDFEIDIYQRMDPSTNPNMLHYDPEYSDQKVQQAIQNKISDAFKAQGKEVALGSFVDGSGNILYSKVREELGEEAFNRVLNEVKNDPKLVQGFMTQDMISKGHSPYAVYDDNAVEIYRQGFSTAVDEWAKPYRPSKTKLTSYKLSKEDKGDDTETPDFKVVESDVAEIPKFGYVDVEALSEVRKLMTDEEKREENPQALAELAKKVSDEIGDADTAVSKEDLEKLKKIDQQSAKSYKIQPTKAGEQIKDINFKGNFGSIREIVLDKNGNGYLVLDTKMGVSETEKQSMTEAERLAYKAIGSQYVPINESDIKEIEELYQVKITPDADPLGIL